MPISRLQLLCLAASKPLSPGWRTRLWQSMKTTIISSSARNRVPAIFVTGGFTRNGGLISYVADFPKLFRDAAGYVDRILRGEKPAELPVQTPTKFNTAINMKTAKVLGLTVPPMLLATADEVIE